MPGILRRLSSRFSRKNNEKRRAKSKTLPVLKTETESELTSRVRNKDNGYHSESMFTSPPSTPSRHRRRLSRAWSNISRMTSFMSPRRRRSQRHRDDRPNTTSTGSREDATDGVKECKPRKVRKRLSMASIFDHIKQHDFSSIQPRSQERKHQMRSTASSKSHNLAQLDHPGKLSVSNSLSYSVTGFTSDDSGASTSMLSDSTCTSSARKRRWERREKVRQMDSLVEKQELDLDPDETISPLKRSPIESVSIMKSYRTLKSDSTTDLPPSTSTSNTSCPGTTIDGASENDRKPGMIKITYISCPHRSSDHADTSDGAETDGKTPARKRAVMDKYKSPYPTTSRVLARGPATRRRVSSPLPRPTITQSDDNDFGCTKKTPVSRFLFRQSMSVDDSVIMNHEVTTPLQTADDRCRTLRRVRSLNDITHYQRYYDFLCKRGTGRHEREVLCSFVNQLHLFREELDAAMSGLPSPRIPEPDMSPCSTPHGNDFSNFCLSYMEQKFPDVFSSCPRLDYQAEGDHDTSWTTSYLETSHTTEHDLSFPSSCGSYNRASSPCLPLYAGPTLDDSWASSSTIINDSTTSQNTSQWTVQLSPSPRALTLANSSLEAHVNGLYAPKPYQREQIRHPYFAPVISPTEMSAPRQLLPPGMGYNLSPILVPDLDLVPAGIDEVDSPASDSSFFSHLSIKLAPIKPMEVNINRSKYRLRHTLREQSATRKYFPDITE